MTELCPNCGGSLDFNWEEGGISLECINCDFKTVPAYRLRNDTNRKFPMDRL